nr:cytidylate kinase-like family protein [uncultured Carboxylicivirga sp.]
MDNLFLQYMKERSGQPKNSGSRKKNGGPVVTISREYGCHGQRIGQLLAERINVELRKEGIRKEWRMISKEILERSASELKLTSALLEDLSDYRQKSFFENLALFFSSSYYPGDVKIKNTIAKFLHDEAEVGNVVIIGRAGEAITKNIKKALHVKMEAPLDWRAEIVSKDENISISDAKKRCIEQDKRRASFRDYFEKDRPDVDFFDIRINAMSMTDEEIVNLLFCFARSRNFW